MIKFQLDTGRRVNSYSCDQPLLDHDDLLFQYDTGKHGNAHATFDKSSKHRFSLGRVWDPRKSIVAFCMLNPSTADAFKLDPTVTRCFGFAEKWGAGGLLVVNLFSLRSTDPMGLRSVRVPNLPRNDLAIARAAKVADIFVVAWGNHGSYFSRDKDVLSMLSGQGAKLFRLGTLTKSGAPRHPLYLSAEEKLLPMTSRVDGP